jgi:hypothetical protein
MNADMRGMMVLAGMLIAAILAIEFVGTALEQRATVQQADVRGQPAR